MNRYPGGKGLSFRNIINLLPPHRVYIETHLGGGAVLRHKKPSTLDIGLDIDNRVTDKWQEIYNQQYDVRCSDAHSFLKNYNFCGDEVIYCDPPYVTHTRKNPKIYRYEYSDQDHIALLEILIKLPCKIIISGYDNKFYNDYLRNWNTRTFSAKTQSGIATEKLWFNYEAPKLLHDTSFLGTNFREREKIRRKLNTMKNKIDNLEVTERNALFKWIVETYSKSNEFNQLTS